MIDVDLMNSIVNVMIFFIAEDGIVDEELNMIENTLRDEATWSIGKGSRKS